MLYSIEMSLTQVEVSAAFPFSFPNNFNQAMVQAMAKHILQHYHRSLTQKGDNILRFSLKTFPNQIFALIQLNLHPGNLTLTHTHPTGLFPNFAYGMIAAAIANFSPEINTISMVDPMAGASTIPILLALEKNYFEKIIGVNSIKWTFSGIEKDPVFWNIAQSNIETFGLSNRIKLDQCDFVDQIDKNFDLIITQPPYGYSIPQEQSIIEELYQKLFNWATQKTNNDAILTLITPKRALVLECAENTPWALIREIPIKEHTIECAIFVFQKRNISN